jgi:hypothetical protein
MIARRFSASKSRVKGRGHEDVDDMLAGATDLKKYTRPSRATDRAVDDPPPGSPELLQVAAAITSIAREFAGDELYAELVSSVLRDLVDHVYVAERPLGSFDVPRLRGAVFGFGLGREWVYEFLSERVEEIAERIGEMLEGK